MIVSCKIHDATMYMMQQLFEKVAEFVLCMSQKRIEKLLSSHVKFQMDPNLKVGRFDYTRFTLFCNSAFE